MIKLTGNFKRITMIMPMLSNVISLNNHSQTAYTYKF